MWARYGAALIVALALALPITIGFAGSNPNPVGRAVLNPTAGSVVSGEAIIRRQLTAGTTEMMVRTSGLAVGSLPVWRVETGAACGSLSTATLLSQNPLSVGATSLGTLMTAETYSMTLPVPATSSMMTVHLYASVSGSSVGTELACGQVYQQPSLTGSQHWW